MRILVVLELVLLAPLALFLALAGLSWLLEEIDALLERDPR